MNVYQSNFNPYYHGQPNHLLISPSSASSIYSNQSLGDENFYTNIDNSNHSLIHMFIKNESKPDQKSLEPYPNCSSAFTSFSSPSPSSSYNSSNGSGQMVTNWTPNSQTGQEEPVVLCQLDELTKNLNNNQMNCKKSKLIGPSLDAAYSQQKGELDPTMPVSYEPNVFNGHCLSSSEQQFLIQQQFNADLIHQQFAMQQPSLQPTAGDRTTHHIQQPLPPNHSSLSSQIPNVKPSLPPLTANAVSVGKVNTPIGPPMDQSIILNPLPAQQASAGAQSYQPNRLSLANCRLKQEQAAGNHLLNAIISYDSEGRPTANKKERRRTLSINNAFTNLRDCIPNVPSDTKLSKIKTLRLATSYISYLMGLLDDSAPMNGKRNRMMMTCEDFKVDLQRFKGRNKNIHLIYPTKFAEKHFSRKAAAESVDSGSSQGYPSQQTRLAEFQSPNVQACQPTDAANKCGGGEIKPNLCAKQTIQPVAYNQVPTIEASSLAHPYDPASKRMKGRTGWPQHVIKNVWASERPDAAQS